MFSRGNYGNFGSDTFFNATYSKSITDINKFHIIRREADPTGDPNLSKDFEDIYYVRKKDPLNFNAYSDMIITFSCQDTSAFGIYSSLKDALQ